MDNLNITGQVTFEFLCKDGTTTAHVRDVPYQFAGVIESWLRGEVQIGDLIVDLQAITGPMKPANKFLEYLVKISDVCLSVI